MSTLAVDEPAAVGLLPDRRRLALRLALVAGVLAALTFAITSLPGLEDEREGRSARVRGALNAGIRDAVRLVGAGHPLILAGAVGFMAFDLLALGAAFAAIGALALVRLPQVLERAPGVGALCERRAAVTA